MVYTTIDKLRDMITDKSLPYFRIFDPSKERLYDNDEVEAPRVSDEVDKLCSYLEELEGTFVFVKVSRDSFKGKNKGGDTQTGSYQYRVNLRGSGSGKGLHSTEGASANKRYDNLLAEFNTLKMQMAIQAVTDKFEARIAAMEEKNGESPLEKYAPLWMPAVAKIAGITLPTQETAPINGTEPPAANPSERLKAACVRLMKVDKDFPSTLETLADFAEKKPDAYNSYIPMLKNL